MHYVQDNLNNRVALDELEYDLVRSAPFARLGRLRQLGLAGWVYPGASHTRAAHSIGVLHTVGKACESLGVGGEEVRLLRVAGLLHDIGQYPLSHCIELAYRAIGDGVSAQELLFGPQEDDNQSLLRRITKMPVKCKDATDKSIGEQVVLRDPDIVAVFTRHGLDDAFQQRVAKLVGGNPTETLHTQLLDSDYDCDRLDYVRRDSVATGVSYGQISVEFLLEKIRLTMDPPNSGERRMVFDRERSIVALEQYLLARFGMYAQVYFHKTVRSLEIMARALQLGLAELERAYRSHIAIREAIGTPNYWTFDDSYFWQRAAEAMDDHALPEELRSLAGRVIRREPLKMAYEYRTLSERRGDPSYILLERLASYGDELSRICHESGVDASHVVVDRLPAVEFVPGNEPLSAERLQLLLEAAAIAEHPGELLTEERSKLLRAPKIVDGEGHVSLLTGDPGSLIAHFADKRLQVVRFYLTEGDGDVALRLRRALRQYSRGE